MKEDSVNKMKKLVTVVGARPQFIKAAITSKELRKNFNEIIVHTGQHYDKNMSDIFFEEMEIPSPDYNLGVGSGTHAVQTAHMMIEIEKVLLLEQPDGVLLYGDTNTTVAAALAAAKLNIPVFHVEAGTRTHVFDMPEEQNRIVTDHLSSICFAPTKKSFENLILEGLEEKAIFRGDVMYDALLFYTEKALKSDREYYINKIKKLFPDTKPIPNDYYFATCHRPENTDDINKLMEIFSALNALNNPVLFAVHPRIRKQVASLYNQYPNIVFIEPLSYFETLYFTKKAMGVITDSGGLHKEAYLQGIPCTTVLRNGWQETLEGNWNVFVRPIKEQIIRGVLNRKIDKTCNRHQFGNGKACQTITKALVNYYEKRDETCNS